MLKYFILLLNLLWCLVFAQEDIVVFHLNEDTNVAAINALQFASTFQYQNRNLNVHLQQVNLDPTNYKTIVKSICGGYNSLLDIGKPPNLILDTSSNNIADQTVTLLSKTLGIPAISISTTDYANIHKLNTFVKVMHPAKLIIKALKGLIKDLVIYRCVLILDDVFVLAENYKDLPFGATTARFEIAISEKVYRLITEGVKHFFYLGNEKNALWFIQMIVVHYESKSDLMWYFIIPEKEEELIVESQRYLNIIFIHANSNTRGSLNKYNKLSEKLKSSEFFGEFYVNIALRSFNAIRMLKQVTDYFSNLTYLSCKEDYNNTRDIEDFDAPLGKYFGEGQEDSPYFGKLKESADDEYFLEFEMELSSTCFNRKLQESNNCSIGKWNVGIPSSTKMTKSKRIILPTLRIAAVLQEPFIFYNYSAPNNLSGMYIDFINILAKKYNFDYNIEIEEKIGDMNDNGEWDGAIKLLIEDKFDILLGFIPVTLLTENVVDFTVPLTEFEGFGILGKDPSRKTELFSFLYILKGSVWLCLLGAYLLISVVLSILDYYSPYSERNRPSKDQTIKVFTLQESLWFCLNSITPQGGGDIPKNISSQLSVITWWIFGFIMVTSYTTNLAAFATVPQLPVRVDSLKDLLIQHDVAYGPHVNSSVYRTFENMRYIEELFFEKWKKLSLSKELSDYERSQYDVWTFPINDQYGSFFKEHGDKLPVSHEEAIERIMRSTSIKDVFLYIAEAVDVKFLVLTNCSFVMIGEEFSKRPHAIALQKNSPLKTIFDDSILELVANQGMDQLKKKWWDNNPKAVYCSREFGSVNLDAVTGLFIILFVGVGTALLILCVEYYLYRRRIYLNP